MIQENDTLTLDIIGLSSEARGIAEYDGKRVLVIDALPGEKVEAKVLKVGKNTMTAISEKIVQANPDRVKDNEKWAHSDYARLANYQYNRQLTFKQERVQKLLAENGFDVKVEKTIASPKQTAYRNEMSLPVRMVNGQLEIGFYKGRTNDFVPLNHFILADEQIGQVLLGVRDVLRKLKVPAYDPVTNTGFIRDIGVRRSETNDGMIVTLVAREKDRIDLPEIVGNITEQLHNINGVVLNYNPHRTKSTYGKRNIPLWGNDYIETEMEGINFKISPRSFFQANTMQVKAIVDGAMKDAGLKKSDQLIDAYCGVGTFGLIAAKNVASVRGIENSRIAILDARENIKNNKIENAKYFDGSVEQIMARWAKQKDNADVVFADPPKKGLSQGFIYATVKMQPRVVIYVSGNPDTMVRDLKLFEEKGYHCQKVTPIDIAPQTPAMKCICVLAK